jgi:phospho-N-acetylmuramoyl-pentapeptide-transferase
MASARPKVGWQSSATLGALAMLLSHPAAVSTSANFGCHSSNIPSSRSCRWWLLLGLIYLWVVGFSNAINLTDGLDGLAVGAAITVVLVLAIMAYVAGNVIYSEYLLISHVEGSGELTVICGALIGGCMAFLWYNSHPAEVFMGDTGSLALGGLLGVMAFMIHQPITLILVGGVFVLETVSVIVQVGWFKFTERRYGAGRRVFLMAPLRHHFRRRAGRRPRVVLRSGSFRWALRWRASPH